MTSLKPTKFHIQYTTALMTPGMPGIVDHPASRTTGFGSTPNKYDIIASSLRPEPTHKIGSSIEPLAALNTPETNQHFKHTSIPAFHSILKARKTHGHCTNCHRK